MARPIKVPNIDAAPSRSSIPIVVCADDYGLTPGVSRGIRELLGARRISATSAMTGSEYWPDEASALAAVAHHADIGLHLTLTDHRPLGTMPTLAPEGRFPTLGRLCKAAIMRQLPMTEIEAEIERQMAAFSHHYGRPPAHIDGHHHVHQLPGIREAVLGVVARLGPDRPYLRCCAEPVAAVLRRGVAPMKALVIGALGRALPRLARRRGVALNNGFSGIYALGAEIRPTAELFARFLVDARPGLLLMCHPGYADAALAARDSFTYGRETELRYLDGEAWPRLLVERGIELGPLPRSALRD